MKAALVCLLAFVLSACLPPTEDEKARAEAARRPAATPVATPQPKPGAWMTEKQDDPLAIKDHGLRKKPKR